MDPPCTQITTGKLSVAFQLTMHHSNKVNGSKPPLMAFTGLIKAAAEIRLASFKEKIEWNMIMYYASNPFLVKHEFDFVCMEAGISQILSQLN